MPTIRTLRRLVPIVVITACLGDTVGPGVLTVVTEGGAVDTLWLGAPGEALPTAVRLRVTDDAVRPLPGASLTWEAVGRNAQVLSPAIQSNSSGLATAGWQLGTDAAEEQRLHVLVRTSRHQSEVVIKARAVPHVVSQLRVLADTPAVLRLGDTLAIPVSAIDPYGNVFPAPEVALSVVDSAFGAVAGQGVVGGPRRGRTSLRVVSHGVVVHLPLEVTQYVATIHPLADTIQLSSLGAEVPVSYAVGDDRGRLVMDTVAAMAVADTTVAQVVDGRVRSLARGVTTLRLELGSAEATVGVEVDQRVASLELRRDTIRFDALLDTTTIYAIARDSLGSLISQPAIVVQVGDGEIATVAGQRTLQALTTGVTVVTLRDPATGVSTSATVIVTQRIVSIDFAQAPLVFDALDDTIIVAATPRDRLGSPVVGAVLDYSVSDSTIVGLDGGNRARSIREGQVVITARDPESGTIADVVASVRQVPTSIVASLRTVDSVVDLSISSLIPVACEARDRNDYLIPGAPSVEPSSGARWTGTRCDSLRVLRSGFDTLRLTAGSARASLDLLLVVRPPELPSAAPAVVARATAGPDETFVSWVPQDPEVDAAAVWIRTRGAPSWDQLDVPDARSWISLPGHAPGTTLEVALALTDVRGSIRGARMDTVTVGDADTCRGFAGYAGTDLRVFCTGPDLLTWVSARGLDSQSVRCGNESLLVLRDGLPNCVFQAGSERLVLLRGLDDRFRPGPALPRPLLRAAYLHVLFGRSSPEATVWQDDPAIGTALPIARVGVVTGYQSAISWNSEVNSIGVITWFEPPNHNGAIAIYHEGHGGDATEIGAETISWLLQRGWSVISLNLPRVPHMYLRDLHSQEDNPLWRLLYGIGQVTEWIHRSWAPGRDPVVVAIGSSGGGWASLLYAALDQRIDATAVVSGFVPVSQRLEESGFNLGDWEQVDPSTFGALDYTDVVRLANTRDLLLTYSELDDCCFRMSSVDPFAQWLSAAVDEAPAPLTTVISSGGQHGFTPGGYAALQELLDRALARGQ